LSDHYGANIYLKRVLISLYNYLFYLKEDMQTIRSYKLRGAYNKITSLSEV